ncbi:MULTISPECIES: hypothetical protein [unclassified Streptomyces]|nr:hypothetical protein [Streptomyces sp. CNQ-509]AIT42125.1 hypothetical protein [Streptomyces sp. CNQ-509]
MTETRERTEPEDPATLSVHLRNHEPASAGNASTRRSGATGGGA